MNPILQRTNNQIKQSPQMNFNLFAQSMTPEGAKAQLDEMVRSGQISESQLQQAILLAKQIAPQFGIKN